MSCLQSHTNLYSYIPHGDVSVGFPNEKHMLSVKPGQQWRCIFLKLHIAHVLCSQRMPWEQEPVMFHALLRRCLCVSVQPRRLRLDSQDALSSNRCSRAMWKERQVQSCLCVCRQKIGLIAAPSLKALQPLKWGERVGLFLSSASIYGYIFLPSVV